MVASVPSPAKSKNLQTGNVLSKPFTFVEGFWYTAGMVIFNPSQSE